MDQPMQLTRYSEPTKMDVAPYMSLCTVSNSKDTVDLYVQRSVDDMDPKWEYVSEISIKSTEEEVHEVISKRYMI